MGRINLSALRVRKRALANIKSEQPNARPIWVDVIHDVPPAQIMTRQQPTVHPLTQTRTTTLPSGRTAQTTQTISPPKPKSYRPSKLFSPTPLRYEEDALRKQFFSDHPWELARPRVILETTGQQHARCDWSTGLLQPGIPLSGESVVQRQLYLLQHVPNITLAESYDVARREFYILRRKEATNRRIATEEAEMLGAKFGVPSMSKAMSIEDKMYRDWEAWAKQQNLELAARNAAFSGQQLTAEKKKKTTGETARVEGLSPGSSAGIGNGDTAPPGQTGVAPGVFAAAARQRSMYNIRE